MDSRAATGTHCDVEVAWTSDYAAARPTDAARPVLDSCAWHSAYAADSIDDASHAVVDAAYGEAAIQAWVAAPIKGYGHGFLVSAPYRPRGDREGQ